MEDACHIKLQLARNRKDVDSVANASVYIVLKCPLLQSPFPYELLFKKPARRAKLER